MVRGRMGGAAARAPGAGAEPAAERRRARSAGSEGRSPEAVAPGGVPVQGQHRPDRDQRVRRLRRPDRRQRRPRSDRELAVLQEPRVQGQADDQRGRDLVGAERRQDRRVGDHRGRAGGLRPPAARGGAGADRLLARRRRRRGAQRHQAHQPAEGQDDRVGAVHRGRLLHPLPRAGGRAADQPARQPRRDAAPRSAERGLHRGRLRGRRPVPERREVGQEQARRRA